MISRHSGARSFRGFNPSTPCSESSLGRVLLTGPCLFTAAQELPQRTRRTLPCLRGPPNTCLQKLTFIVSNLTYALGPLSQARNPLSHGCDLRTSQTDKMPKRRAGTSHCRNGADQGRRGFNNSGWLDFGEQPFGVGNSRLAFRCRVRDGCCHGYTEGSYLVFKVFKPEDRWSRVSSVSHIDVMMQQRVRHLAEQFNAEAEPEKYGEPCNIICRDAALGHFEVRETCVRQTLSRIVRSDKACVCRTIGPSATITDGAFWSRRTPHFCWSARFVAISKSFLPTRGGAPASILSWRLSAIRAGPDFLRPRVSSSAICRATVATASTRISATITIIC